MATNPSPAPTRQTLIGTFVFCLLLAAVGAGVVGTASFGEYRSSQRTASVIGDVDAKYTERTRNVSEAHYDVTYTYTVDGKQYTGSDTLGEEPIVSTTKIFYDPANPSSSQAENHEAPSTMSLAVQTVLFGAIGLAGLAGMAYAVIKLLS